MAEYKTIKGFKTQSYATDPIATQIAGGTWASGGTLTTTRYDVSGLTGTQTSQL